MKTISVRLENKEYDELDEMLDSMGMTKQTFYETYTKAALRTRKIPFAIEAPLDPFYSEENQNRLKHSINQESEGKVVTKTMETLEAMGADE